MAKAATLFDKAAANWRLASYILSGLQDDEEQLNFAGYHLQQAFELALKFLLEQNGVEYPKTHDVERLISLGGEEGVDLMLDDYLDDHAEMLSSWESRSRYVIGYIVEERKLRRALSAIDAYLTRIATAFGGDVR